MRRPAPLRSIGAAAWSATASIDGSAFLSGLVPTTRARMLTGAAAAVIVGAGSALELAAASGVETLSLLFVVALVSLPLVVALIAPLVAWRVMTIALFGSALLVPVEGNPWPWPVTAFVAYLAVTFVAAFTAPRHALLGLALLGCALPVLPAGPQERLPDGIIFLLFGLVILVVSLGGVLRETLTTRRALDDEVERSRAELVRATILAERNQLARELHDVVAHHMSVIAIHADVTPHAVPDLPDTAREAFRSIRGEATTALAEMRRLVDTLRDVDDGADRRPQPVLDDLVRLVESVRTTGTPITLVRSGASGTVPSPVAVSAYRITQEALANALQHAPGAAVSITVGQTPRDLTVSITNGAPAALPPRSDADDEGRARRRGQGLIGMRERAHLLGGTVSAGPTPSGGFAVSASLPLDTHHASGIEDPS